jgi:hypothetical protein
MTLRLIAIAGSFAALVMLYGDTGPREANQTDDVNDLIFDSGLLLLPTGETGFCKADECDRLIGR